MRKRPERTAWQVLWLAFITFWLLAIGIPLGIRSYILNARDSQDAQLLAIGGTLLVEKAEGGDPIGVMEDLVLAPGDRVLSDAASSGTIDLFDRSHVTLYSNTSLAYECGDEPRYRLGDRPNEIVLTLSGGFISVGVALPGERDTRFQVVTPHTEIVLAEGSYRIEVTNDGTQVTVIRGEALIGPGDAPIKLLQGTRSRVALDGTPSSPLPAVQNLIENGNFRRPLETTWLTSTVVLTESVAPATIKLVDDAGRRAVRLSRQQEGNGDHTEAAIQQKLDYDVRDFTRIEIVLDVKLSHQSLSGGGEQSSEFPVIVRLDYKDIWGNDKFWTHGFYYQNQQGFPIALDPWGKPFGEQIPRGVWYPFQSGNLLAILGDNKPARLTSLKVYASGWNYDSLVSEIQLLVE